MFEEEVIDTVDVDTWQAYLHRWAHNHAHRLEEGSFMSREPLGESSDGYLG